MINAYYVSVRERPIGYVPRGRALGGITRKTKPTNIEVNELRKHIAKQYNLTLKDVVVEVEPTRCSEDYCIGGTLVEAYESLAA